MCLAPLADSVPESCWTKLLTLHCAPPETLAAPLNMAYLADGRLVRQGKDPSDVRQVQVGEGDLAHPGSCTCCAVTL